VCVCVCVRVCVCVCVPLASFVSRVTICCILLQCNTSTHYNTLHHTVALSCAVTLSCACENIHTHSCVTLSHTRTHSLSPLPALSRTHQRVERIRSARIFIRTIAFLSILRALPRPPLGSPCDCDRTHIYTYICIYILHIYVYTYMYVYIHTYV